MTTQATDDKLLAQPGHRPHLPGMTRSAQVPGGTRPAGQVSHEQPPRGRLARLFQAADRRHVPLRTILVTVAVLVATYLAGQLISRLRDIVLLMLVAGLPRCCSTRPGVTGGGGGPSPAWGRRAACRCSTGSPTWRTGCPATSPARSTATAGSATSWPGTTSRAGCSATRPDWPATPSRSASRP